MKKTIITLIASFCFYVSYSQTLYSHVQVFYGDMEDPCKEKINICLEVFWSPSGNCAGEDVICNLWCADFQHNMGQMLGSTTGVDGSICSNKLIITTPNCYFELPINNLEVGMSYVFNDCECCYKVVYLGSNNPLGDFYITKC